MELPRKAVDWLLRAGRFLDEGYLENARLALRQADAMAPDEAPIYRGLAAGYCAAGLAAEAGVAEMAAIAFEQRSAPMLYNLATSFLMTQKPVGAERWYRACLRLDPDMVAAHQNLASIMEVDGRAEFARYHRDQAYGRQSIFFDQSENAQLTVLILCTAATGNVPFDWLLPQARFNRVRWVMEYARDEQFESLPEFDLVFNAIGDHDVSPASQAAMARLLAGCDKPVLNSPQAVALTARENLPTLFGNINHLLVPKALRLQQAPDDEHLRENGMIAPLLVRPIASHGGKGLRLYTTEEQLAQATWPSDAAHVCAYHDYRSEDGFFRKYRVIFIGGKPYPYHLAISENWLVHYATADMLHHQWKRDEELRFLAYPAAVLGWSAMQALRGMGRRLELDFFGVDCSILSDGRLLVFEANATMLVHLEEYHAELQFKNPYVQKILDAFDALLKQKANRVRQRRVTLDRNIEGVLQRSG